MSAHADEIRDAEILELQRRVKSLEERVKALEARPVYVPYPAPACPMPAYPANCPHWHQQTPFRKPW